MKIPIVFRVMFSIRLLCLTVALLFVPFCAIPVSFTATIDAMLVGLGTSVLWNLFAILNILIWNISISWPCYLLGDGLVFPGMAACFVVISLFDGLENSPQPKSPSKQTIVATSLLAVLGVLHIVAFALSVFHGLSNQDGKSHAFGSHSRFTGGSFVRTSRPSKKRGGRINSRASQGMIAVQEPNPVHLATFVVPSATNLNAPTSRHPDSRLSEETLPRYADMDLEALPPYESKPPSIALDA